MELEGDSSEGEAEGLCESSWPGESSLDNGDNGVGR